MPVQGRLQRMTSSAAQLYDDRPARAGGAYGAGGEPTEQPPEDQSSSGAALLLLISLFRT